MFQLSSTIPTQSIPRTIFVKKGWTIDSTNNETKLFCQVNHPNLIKDVCSLAKDVVCSQEALSDVLASVDLDLYINRANDNFPAQKQVGKTCYAVASAIVLHLAMHRIVGRDDGYPDFMTLRDDMIHQYGTHSADTMEVLQDMCPRYRLHCRPVDVWGAQEAITKKRPVLARFGCTEAQWNIFRRFFRCNEGKILTEKDLDINMRTPGEGRTGHAVVLTSFNSHSLCLMNSWGTGWGDNGFFRVQNADVLNMKFVDVFWDESDLTPSEKGEFRRRGPKIADDLMNRLKGLQTAIFQCPLCHERSKVTEFTGRLVQARCPRCHQDFDSNDSDSHDIVLNMYLTSLC